jgi:hypothetical protein
MIPFLSILPLLALAGAPSETLRIEGPAVRCEVDPATGAWAITSVKTGTRWPSAGLAESGLTSPLEVAPGAVSPTSITLRQDGRDRLRFNLVDEGRALEIAFPEPDLKATTRALSGALRLASPDSALIVPAREGLLVPRDGPAFRRSFGASEYEGCHMNMIGVIDRGEAMLVTWDGAEVKAELDRAGEPGKTVISATLALDGRNRAVRLTPLGKGDLNTLAAGYRKIAEAKGLAVTLGRKIDREPHAERLVGASNVKLWTCLARRRNEESTADESVTVHWTFDEAARVAEHLRDDLGLDRCLFTIGGWTEGGYDVRHPDALPANPECGGDAALADAVRRIQSLGFVASLHDNYQDMYRDAKSWDTALIEKKPDGSLVQGGRWLGGRAFMVCAPNQLMLAQRPQNLPEIHARFAPWSYFIDTTYAVGPRTCADPSHPLTRDEDIAWKRKLSDAARQRFGLFGSECGREWALPHSDFFEGLSGVGGQPFHQLKPEALGATVIPFFEMVYHDCQIVHGKYGYDAASAAPYVASHVLYARPLHYHSMPNHLYWKTSGPRPAPSREPEAAFLRNDHGWAAGLHPSDVFLKNTHEVLGPLHAATGHDRLTAFSFLSSDHTVRQAVYGSGESATRVIVNMGRDDATVDDLPFGGQVVLPANGFVVEGPRFIAFHAKRWGGHAYPEAALFTIQPAAGEEKDLARAPLVRVYHGFGDPIIPWAGDAFTIERDGMIGRK